MSAPPRMRRGDRVMAEADVLAMLDQGFSGRLAVIGEDGWPYCVPMLYVWREGTLWLHGTMARGHLRSSIEAHSKVCFEIDEPDQVYAYGRFECDTGLAYRSCILFGQARVVEDTAAKQRFFEALMRKYAGGQWQERPRDFFPRMDHIVLYAVTVERMTGKHSPLPEVAARWPALDRTMTPDAKPGP